MTGERTTQETVSFRCSGEATQLLGNNPAALYKKKNFMSDVQSAQFSLSLTLSIKKYQEDIYIH